jgi:hypothetical protein
MSYQNGMAALRLKTPDSVPRTEYSAHTHWPLVERVTGIRVDAGSDAQTQARAGSAFLKAWDYGFYWNILTHNQIFGDQCTKMGHAVYADGGVDFSSEVHNLFEDPEDVYDYDFDEKLGPRDEKAMIGEYNADFREKRALYPDTLNMTGIYVTMMSGMIEMLGWDTLLTAAGIDIKAFGAFADRYADWVLQYFKALAKCDSPVVMVHDDIVWTSGAFMHPEFYQAHIFPNYKKLFRPLHEAGKLILYTSDGNFTQFIDDIAACGVNGFVLEPCTDMGYIAEKYGKTHAFVGNADTRVLLSGSRDDIRREVKRCMDIGKRCPGFFMAVGNHIPSNTPVDNALWYNECFENMRRR